MARHFDRLVIVGCVILSTNARGQTIGFLGVPNGGGQGNIGQTDPSCRVSGNTITCPNGGVLVHFSIHVTGWGDGTGRELGSIQATVDGATLHNGFYQVLPLGYPADPRIGAYQVRHLCFAGASDGLACGNAALGPFGPGLPGVTEQECQADGGLFCVSNPEFVIDCCDPVHPQVYVTGLNYSWGFTVGPSGGCRSDDGGLWYLGDYVLEVPAGAGGEWTIGWLDDINLTFMGDCDFAGYIPIADLLPGVLRIWPDCNENGIDDLVDIANGTSQDCNDNGIPDECDLVNGSSSDCNGNAVPDECDPLPDCDANGVPDVCEIPPVGPPEGDCNTNGVLDACDINAGDSIDCNNNGIPDECDVVSGDSSDCNDNGVPDECEEDGDGVIDGCDRCPGANDAVYGPQCADAIPTVSAWGLAVLTLLLLVVGKLYFRRADVGVR